MSKTIKESGEKSPPTTRQKLPFGIEIEVLGDAIMPFTLSDFLSILTQTGAPPVADTLNAREIVLKINLLIDVKKNPAQKNPRFAAYQKIQKQEAKFIEAWGIVEAGIQKQIEKNKRI